VSVFIVPLSVLAATYFCICREVWLHAGRSPQSHQGNCSPLISRAKINTVKQMVAVLALYVACSAPFISTQLWATWDVHAHESPFATGIQCHLSNPTTDLALPPSYLSVYRLIHLPMYFFLSTISNPLTQQSSHVPVHIFYLQA
jgi:hypothetical protein